jgi:hypothetical protein
VYKASGDAVFVPKAVDAETRRREPERILSRIRNLFAEARRSRCLRDGLHLLIVDVTVCKVTPVILHWGVSPDGAVWRTRFTGSATLPHLGGDQALTSRTTVFPILVSHRQGCGSGSVRL